MALRDIQHGRKASIAGKVFDAETGERITGPVQVVGCNPTHDRDREPCVNVKTRDGRHWSVPVKALKGRG